MENTTISLIDPGGLFREGVKRLLESADFTVSAEVGRIEEYLKLEKTTEDVILLNGEVTPEDVVKLHKARGDAHLVIMADQMDVDHLRRFFTVGVDGYLLRSLSSTAFVSSIRLVALGEKVFPSELAMMISSSNVFHQFFLSDEDEESTDLSDRETEIIRILSEGASNKVIANKLLITEATVKVHLKSILRKLGLENRSQAAIWAVRHGLAA